MSPADKVRTFIIDNKLAGFYGAEDAGADKIELRMVPGHEFNFELVKQEFPHLTFNCECYIIDLQSSAQVK